MNAIDDEATNESISTGFQDLVLMGDGRSFHRVTLGMWTEKEADRCDLVFLIQTLPITSAMNLILFVAIFGLLPNKFRTDRPRP